MIFNSDYDICDAKEIIKRKRRYANYRIPSDMEIMDLYVPSRESSYGEITSIKDNWNYYGNSESILTYQKQGFLDQEDINEIKKECFYNKIDDSELQYYWYREWVNEAERRQELLSLSHEEYCQSKWWNFIRNERLTKDGFRCVMCGSALNLQVHHITYGRKGHEDINDLRTICKCCHNKVHETDNYRRNRHGQHKRKDQRIQRSTEQKRRTCRDDKGKQ